jgi:3-hydroxyisobutyrate dehydrogenase-like beta-hydroxyacid dehydrogenase
MADNKSQVGEPDRSRVVAAEHYEVQHLAERTGISTDEARELIERFGNDRDTLEREAAKLRRY